MRPTWAASADLDSQAIYEAAGADEDAPPGPGWFAWRLFGDRGTTSFALGGGALVVGTGASRRLLLTPGLSPAREGIAIARAIARHFLELRGAVLDAERIRDIAARLIAPRAAFLAEIGAVGLDLAQLARSFVTSEALVALRIGETTGRPVAVVDDKRVTMRGRISWTDSQARALALDTPAGVHRTRLSDDPCSVAIVLLTA